MADKFVKATCTKDDIVKDFHSHLKYNLSVLPDQCDYTDKYIALAYTVRDRIIDRWFATRRSDSREMGKSINYFSFEFLMGRALGNNMINMGIDEAVMEALPELGINWLELQSAIKDSGLGNGGLGRLAACFLDSLASIGYPAFGYGLRYKYGFFKQDIQNGYQVEEADDWLRNGNPWEIKRYDISVMVQFGGRVARNRKGECFWVDTEDVTGIPYDTPVVGYGADRVNTLRLWDARSVEDFDFQNFNQGNYYSTIDDRVKAETLTMVLYPNDEINEGVELRFKQQYFFVSCSLQDIFRRFKKMNLPFSDFPEKMAVQLNDTHPAIAVAELMRLLMDKEKLDWDTAWDITVRTMGYTNHTLMPEALETWSVGLFEKLLPRHLEIIYQINHFFMQDVAGRYPGDFDKMERLSLISEKGGKRVRMANLAILGSHSVNGVAALHSRLVKENLVPDFYALYPDRFNNKTNGITQRRWLRKANRPLSDLITSAIGDSWITDLSQLRRLEEFKDDSSFLERLRDVKKAGKETLADHCRRQFDIELNTDTLFDVQVKRVHEYKRQLLNLIHVVSLYNRIRQGEDIEPRTVLFSGKAAPGYYMAKLIIKLINNVAAVINGDKKARDILKVHFLPNYSVSLAEMIFPAADLSEQISTAGTEASGTGNMKFILNGALTIGTLDGANIEILEEVGSDNMFIFGLKTAEVEALKKSYDPMEYYLENHELKSAMELIGSGYFNISERNIFNPLINNLMNHDFYMHFADFGSYAGAQRQVEKAYRDKEGWSRSSLMNIAGSGKFSSDRTIREYADEIWSIKPIPVGDDKGE
ncbi:MAG: glycogen/starch/alpha-glucan phosphorylase [Spirochaetales bacterium]|nr:glycogen/starch/alpha-glucan phosphorylase [Spirochaetales bacterium]